MKAEWIEISDFTRIMNTPNGCFVCYRAFTHDEQKSPSNVCMSFDPDINYNEESGEWEVLKQIEEPFRFRHTIGMDTEQGDENE